ncbi:hypothetical protein QJQ45_015632 [Haematococcus lacustris]|nr:hypothetical protein QJQ45_015632 [Haematococcus lacustris]
MGPVGRLALPPQAVQLLPPPPGLTLPSPVAAFTAVSRGDRGGGGAQGGSKGVRARVGGSVSAAMHWWQRAEPQRWERYVAEPSRLGLSHRPLLVFVNLKSGPQMGATMLQQLLQLLHPLQVCELPREGPEAALRFFSALRGLRVLVMGGDGTVGWVLQAIHTLSLQQQQAALQQQQQADGAGAAGEGMGPGAPPCATPPQEGRLGLASGLQGGGGGAAAGPGPGGAQPQLAAGPGGWVLGGGAPACVAATTSRHPPHGHCRAIKGLMRRAQAASSSSSAPPSPAPSPSLSPAPSLPKQPAPPLLPAPLPAPPAAAPNVPPPKASRQGGQAQPLLLPPPTPLGAAPLGPGGGVGCRQLSLNNYLGVGIDAKVALEFHRIREAMPGFFRSQLGNKVWYTGIGAPDLLRRSCADLHLKLRLECDGVEVALPPDAEGLVITNIPCHMGGVYLWETGLPAPPIALPPGASPDCQAAAANLTTNRRQALADGLIEVVALGGVAHLGRLSLGLARAQRLCQCRSVALTTLTTLPMQSVGCGSLQVDGEPWLQEPAQLQLQHCSTVSATAGQTRPGQISAVAAVSVQEYAHEAQHCNHRVAVSRRDAQALMLRRRAGDPAQRVAAVVLEVLEASEAHGHITAAQRAALQREMAAALELL